MAGQNHSRRVSPRRMLRLRRVEILACSTLFAFIMLLVSLWIPPYYRFSATVHLNPAPESAASDLGTEMAILTSDYLISKALSELGVAAEISTQSAPYFDKLLPDSLRKPPAELNLRYLEDNEKFYDKPITYKVVGSSLQPEPKGAPHPDMSAQMYRAVKGQTFTLTLRRKADYIRSIKPRLHAQAGEPAGGRVIHVHFEDQDAATARRFLNALVNVYIKESRERQLVSLHKSMAALERSAAADKQWLFEKEQQWRRLTSLEKLKSFQSSLDTLYAELAARKVERTSLANNQNNPERAQALTQQIESLEKQIALLSAEASKYEGLKRDVQQLRQRFDAHQNAITQLNIRASELYGYASIIDTPGNHAEMVGTPVQNMVMIGAIIGFVVGYGWFVSCGTPPRGSNRGSPRSSGPSAPHVPPVVERVFV